MLQFASHNFTISFSRKYVLVPQTPQIKFTQPWKSGIEDVEAAETFNFGQTSTSHSQGKHKFQEEKSENPSDSPNARFL